MRVQKRGFKPTLRASLAAVLLMMMLLSIAAFLLGRSLGPVLQKEITTQPNPGSMVIVDVYPVSANVHRVVTSG